MLFNLLFILQTNIQWGRKGSIKYPWRATDYIRELFDELACAGDDFVGLLLSGVPGKKSMVWKQKESTFTKDWEDIRYANTVLL